MNPLRHQVWIDEDTRPDDTSHHRHGRAEKPEAAGKLRRLLRPVHCLTNLRAGQKGSE
jgi:hypothetical protein